MIKAQCAFVEIHVATSLEECERSDQKGLYKLAREGKIRSLREYLTPMKSLKCPNYALKQRIQKLTTALRKFY